MGNNIVASMLREVLEDYQAEVNPPLLGIMLISGHDIVTTLHSGLMPEEKRLIGRKKAVAVKYQGNAYHAYWKNTDEILPEGVSYI